MTSHRMVTSQGVTVTACDKEVIRTVEDKTHSHNSNCIYSVANLTGTLLSSLC